MFCLVTSLLNWREYPALEIAQAYKWRWDGSETALREAKSAIDGADPSAGPMLRSGSPALIAQEIAGWTAGTEMPAAWPATQRPWPLPRERAAGPGFPSTPARSPSPPPATSSPAPRPAATSPSSPRSARHAPSLTATATGRARPRTASPSPTPPGRSPPGPHRPAWSTAPPGGRRADAGYQQLSRHLVGKAAHQVRPAQTRTAGSRHGRRHVRSRARRGHCACNQRGSLGDGDRSGAGDRERGHHLTRRPALGNPVPMASANRQ
jgi:hypothetical protein